MKYLNKYTAISMIGMILGMFLYIQFEPLNKADALQAIYNTTLEEYNYVNGIYKEKEAEIQTYEARLESLKNELESLSKLLANLKADVDAEKDELFSKGEITPKLTDLDRWQIVHDLRKPLTEYWEGTVLEDKVDDLLLWCKASTVPRICAKVIAAQTQIETSFGTTGVGKTHKNLTGIRDSGKWRSYEQYHYSLKDSVDLFIQGDYEDYFTIHGWTDGLRLYLKRWGTLHTGEVRHICEEVLK
jgi:hypothetical protein